MVTAVLFFYLLDRIKTPVNKLGTISLKEVLFFLRQKTSALELFGEVIKMKSPQEWDESDLLEMITNGWKESIDLDFKAGYIGVKQLPRTSRFGVYVAYVYYLALFEKIRNTPSSLVLKTRIRIRNRQKVTLLAYSFIKHQLNLL